MWAITSHHGEFNLVVAVISLAVARSGLAWCLAHLWPQAADRAGGSDWKSHWGRSTPCCKNKYYFDELYHAHHHPARSLAGQCVCQL